MEGISVSHWLATEEPNTKQHEAEGQHLFVGPALEKWTIGYSVLVSGLSLAQLHGTIWGVTQIMQKIAYTNTTLDDRRGKHEHTRKNMMKCNVSTAMV